MSTRILQFIDDDVPEHRLKDLQDSRGRIEKLYRATYQIVKVPQSALILSGLIRLGDPSQYLGSYWPIRGRPPIAQSSNRALEALHPHIVEVELLQDLTEDLLGFGDHLRIAVPAQLIGIRVKQLRP